MGAITRCITPRYTAEGRLLRRLALQHRQPRTYLQIVAQLARSDSRQDSFTQPVQLLQRWVLHGGDIVWYPLNALLKCVLGGC